MLSLVAGLRTGVAKNVRPIIVRQPGPAGLAIPPTMSAGQWLKGLVAIYDDLTFGKQVTVQAIVLLATYFPRSGPGGFTESGQPAEADAFELQAYRLLEKLVERGAVLVTGSGNTREGGFNTDGWPANFGKESNAPYYIPSLMVVGATDSNGQKLYGKHDYPNGIPHFYAAGVDTIVANGDSRSPHLYRDTRGTSNGESKNTRAVT